jgi:hypothetical protein
MAVDPAGALASTGTVQTAMRFDMNQEVIARAGIARTLATCAQAGDARKVEVYAQCFAEHGVLELAARIEGREAIRRWLEGPRVIRQPDTPAPGFVSHHLTTCNMMLTSGSTAKVRTYFLVITAIGLDHSGYYDDQFLQVGAAWLIAHRRPRTLWRSPESLIVEQE